MDSLKSLFVKIKKTFELKRVVDFPEYGLSFELRPLTSREELKVLEACKDFEGAIYIDALKKHSLAYGIKRINELSFEEDSDLEYEDDAGKPVKVSSYLFLLEKIDELPSTFRDTLFDVFSNLLEEMEHKITDKAKFEKFTIQPPPAPEPKQDSGAPPGFRRVEEPKDEPEDEMEKMERQAKREVEQAQMAINQIGRASCRERV